MVIIRIHQTMKVDNEIPHLSAVNGPLRGLSPGSLRFGKAWIDADNVELLQVAESDALKVFKFAAEYEMKKLLV